MPSRRTILSATGTGLTCGLGGCSSLFSSNVPSIESKNVEVVGSECVKESERQRNATISYDSTQHQLSISGVTVTDSPCAELYINPDKGVGKSELKDDAYQIIVGMLSGECEPCPAEVEYDATVEFSHDPSTIYVYHTEEVDDRLRPVGPVTSKNIR